jgi:hypothetical protein
MIHKDCIKRCGGRIGLQTMTEDAREKHVEREYLDESTEQARRFRRRSKLRKEAQCTR